MVSVYRITQLNTAQRGGANQPVDAEIRGIAKTNDLGPFTIANEIVAARVGQALGLPIPAGVIAEHERTLYYLSLDVSREGKTLPPVLPDVFVADEPLLAAGSLVFDILIANNDRNAGNIARDEAFDPPRVSLFDHGHALLGTAPAPIGEARLNAARGELGCDGLVTPGNRQLFIDLVSRDRDLLHWVERVEELPAYVIDDACQEAAAAPINLDTAGARALSAWLTDRAASIREIISTHQAEFLSVKEWGLDWPAAS